jgi:preprotein translocase subunit SecE
VVQEETPNKPVHLIFLGGSLILFYLLQWTIDWLWGYFTKAPSEFLVTSIALVVSLTVGIALFRNEKVYGLANDVALELKKVTWPAGKEVRAATIVVIVMTLISATIIGIFDFAWAHLTDVIYG